MADLPASDLDALKAILAEAEAAEGDLRQLLQKAFDQTQSDNAEVQKALAQVPAPGF